MTEIHYPEADRFILVSSKRYTLSGDVDKQLFTRRVKPVQEPDTERKPQPRSRLESIRKTVLAPSGMKGYFLRGNKHLVLSPMNLICKVYYLTLSSYLPMYIKVWHVP